MAQGFEVHPERVGREVEGSKSADSDEDVVRQNGEPVVREGERDEVRHVGEHRRVQVLDGVARQVQVSKVCRHLRQGRRRHGHELVSGLK